MTVALAHITFDCADPQRVAGFWSQVLERPVDEGASEFFASIDDHVAGAPSWFFIQVPEPKRTKNRLHLDLTAVDRGAEVERLISLGAALRP
ncbi:MAG: VOC family protein [Mycobacteriales bacterium]